MLASLKRNKKVHIVLVGVMVVIVLFEVIGGTLFLIHGEKILAPIINDRCRRPDGIVDEQCKSVFLRTYLATGVTSLLFSALVSMSIYLCCAVGSAQRVWRRGEEHADLLSSHEEDVIEMGDLSPSRYTMEDIEKGREQKREQEKEQDSKEQRPDPPSTEPASVRVEISESDIVDENIAREEDKEEETQQTVMAHDNVVDVVDDTL